MKEKYFQWLENYLFKFLRWSLIKAPSSNIQTGLLFIVGRVSINCPGDLSSDPGRVTPKTLNIRYVSRVKWSNPGKWVAPSPTPRCSSYWKGSPLVALDYGRQLYLLTYWYIHNVCVDKFFGFLQVEPLVHTESPTEPFLWSTGVDCFTSVNHDREKVIYGMYYLVFLLVVGIKPATSRWFHLEALSNQMPHPQRNVSLPDNSEGIHLGLTHLMFPSTHEILFSTNISNVFFQ